MILSGCRVNAVSSVQWFATVGWVTGRASDPQINLLLLFPKGSFPSRTQHLSCDVCLEVEREDYQNCSMLCCLSLVHNDTHTHEQFLVAFSLALGLFYVFV